jgi:propanol-preferring alcohol dehydrogenase
MRAMILERVGPLKECNCPLRLAKLPIPQPKSNEVRLRVAVCGVCHTELDEIEGRTPPTKLPIVLGHQAVGVVDRLGAAVTTLKIGDRVGVGWIHSSTGDRDENLSPQFRATGRDVDGGYAEYMTVPEDYAYKIPDVFTDIEAAPLLCAGAIGYRALKLTGLIDGEPLGLMGFGSSAHLVLQLARREFPNSPVYVLARNEQAREFAMYLGAAWAGDVCESSPVKLAAVIDTTPAWTPIVRALANLQPGGRLVINAIRKVDADKKALLEIDYAEHLWMEREIKSTANITRVDIQEFIGLAAEIPLRPKVTTYSLEKANQAILELHQGQVQGAKVLLIGESDFTSMHQYPGRRM